MIRFIRAWMLCLGVCLALPVAAAETAPTAAAVVHTVPDSLDADWSRVAEYRLVPGDVLVLNYGPNELTTTGFLEREIIVRPDGRISVFPVGDVVAAGRTPRDLEAAVVDMLSVTFREPRVTIEVAKIAGNQVHVLGRVARPGSYPAEPFVTATQAIAAAGGFSDDAARNSVVVFHRAGARELSVEVLPLDRMVKRGSLAADKPLSRFDIVYVPRSTIGNFNTFVQQAVGPAGTVFSTALLGWELFHLDRVFFVK